ncbi:MAG: leucine-rich repeat domain-containing protein [Clostridia bacterium]|nr:leucine-rich repeat domain-containing protein [Clostridia bacterium]
MKRTKKILVGLLATLSVLSGALGLVACDNGSESSSSVSNSSTQQSSSSNVSSETESSSGEEDNSGEEVGTFSQGLEYTLLDDDDTYEVTGIGSCTDTEIVIPSRYNGKSVTSIGIGAFEYCDSLTSVEIPDSVTSIGRYAFFGCSILTNVVIPESVMSIGYRTFVGASLQFNEYGNGKYLGSKTNDYFALIEATSTDLSGFSIHNDTKVIADSAFSNCDSSTYNIKNNLKYVGTKQNHYLYLAGVNDTSIASATIENTCKFIGYSAFEDCDSLESYALCIDRDNC